ncbi:MAG: hypothetical protein AB7V62_14995 [Thermoleophilia bacterium]
MPSDGIPTILGALVTLFVAGGAAVFFAYQQCSNRYGSVAASRLARSPRTLILLSGLALLPIDAVHRWEPTDPHATVAASYYPELVVALSVGLWVVLLVALLRQLRPRAVAKGLARRLTKRRLGLWADHLAWSRSHPKALMDDLDALTWREPITVILMPPSVDGGADNPEGSSGGQRQDSGRTRRLLERRVAPGLRKARLRARYLVSGWADDPLAGFAETTQVALERGDQRLWDQCFHAARRRLDSPTLLSERSVNVLLGSLRILEARARPTPLANRVVEIAETLAVIARRAPLPEHDEEPVSLELAELGARSRDAPEIAVAVAGLLADLGHEPDRSRAATRSLAALGERVVGWPSPGLQIIGHQPEPFLGVVYALSDLWEQAAKESDYVLGDGTQTAFGIISVHLPAELGKRELEIYLYWYARVGRESAQAGWSTYAFGVANDLGVCLTKLIADAGRDPNERRALETQIVQGVLRIGASSLSQSTTAGSGIIDAEETAEVCLRILTEADVGVLEAAAREVYITRTSEPGSKAREFIGALQERMGHTLGFTRYLNEADDET